MFIVSMAMIVGGYALLYYGYSMYQSYKGAGSVGVGTAVTGGIPLSIVLGLSGLGDAAKKPGSKPPFALGGNSGSTQPSSNSTGTSATGGGVQSV